MTQQFDDRQIQDGNIAPPDLAHFNWTLTQTFSGTIYPVQFSGSKISGDKDLYWIEDIYRDSGTYLPFRVVDTLYNNKDGSIRWRKDDYIIRQNNLFLSTSGTISGENSDK